MTQVLHGIVHGKTIELAQESGVPEGQAVEVVIRPIRVPPGSEPWGDGRSACCCFAGWPRQYRAGKGELA